MGRGGRVVEGLMEFSPALLEVLRFFYMDRS